MKRRGANKWETRCVVPVKALLEQRATVERVYRTRPIPCYRLARRMKAWAFPVNLKLRSNK